MKQGKEVYELLGSARKKKKKKKLYSHTPPTRRGLCRILLIN